MSDKSKRTAVASWEHDITRVRGHRSEWWWVPNLPIGVMRDEDGLALWAPAYVEDGLPAGSHGYRWYSDLDRAKVAATRLNVEE